MKQRVAIPTPWHPASSPLWPRQAIVSFRPVGERTGHHAPQRAETRQLYRSPNGDSWSFARDPARGTAFVRHQANAPSGGQVTDNGDLRIPQRPAKSRARSAVAPDRCLDPRSARGPRWTMNRRPRLPAGNGRMRSCTSWATCSSAASRLRKSRVVCAGTRSRSETKSPRLAGPAGSGLPTSLRTGWGAPSSGNAAPVVIIAPAVFPRSRVFVYNGKSWTNAKLG
jgi:hypothetical protein